MNLWGRRRCLMASKEAPFATVAGSIASFIAKRATPIMELNVAIDPVQSGSGDPSPENIRPISGFPEANIWHTGKNLYNPASIYSGLFNPDGTFSTGDGTGSAFIETGQAGSSAVISQQNMKKLLWLPAGTYTASCKSTSGDTTNGGTIRKVNPDGTQTTFGANFKIENHVATCTFTLTEDTFVAFRLNQYSIKYSDFMVEKSDEATVYEAYSGTKIAISWQTEAGTVYGGTLDVLNGKLTVTHESRTLDNNSNWGVTSNGIFYVNHSLDGLEVGDTYHPAFFLCNKYKYQGFSASSSYIADDGIYVNNHNTYGRRVFVKDSNYSTVDSFKGSLENSPIVVCGKLVTPVEYDLTSIELNTIVGKNHIWADAGNITITAAGIKEITPTSAQALNMLLGGMYTNNHTPDDVSDDEALNIILGGSNA